MSALQRFGPFVIFRAIGRGGMGEVFLARTPYPNAPVAALKRLRPDVARIPTFSERFRHEAALALRLEHANIVDTLDVGEIDGQLYVASELVLGKDAGYIADRLRMRSQGGPAAVALRLVVDALAGLAYVHAAQDEDGTPLSLVHRDVTPGNLLLGYDGRTRLADFGLAKSYLSEGNRLTKQGEILGTPHYLAPEVVRGDPARPVSDIYGLGAVAYRFLTGIAPFQGGTSEVLMKVLTSTPRPLGELRPDLPAWMVSALEEMLQPNPSLRPSDARVFAERLVERARQADMLVPRTAVGRWLAQLFETEQREEQKEYERVLAMTGEEALAPTREGTYVLVPTVDGHDPTTGGTPIMAGGETAHPLTTSFTDDDHGTELDLVASQVLQIGDKTPEVQTPRPSLGSSPPIEAYEADMMPTRAVEVAAHAESDGEAHDTDIERKAAQRRLGFVEEPDTSDTLDAAALPGFADLEPVAPTARAPLPPPEGGRGQESSDPLLVTPVEEERPIVAPNPLVGEVPEMRAETMDAAPRDLRRPAFFLGGLLCLAIALGIGLGKVVASLRAAPTTAVPLAPMTPLSQARARLEALNEELDARTSRNAPVPAAVWRNVAQAAGALLDGNVVAATEALDAAERELSRASN